MFHIYTNLHRIMSTKTVKKLLASLPPKACLLCCTLDDLKQIAMVGKRVITDTSPQPLGYFSLNMPMALSPHRLPCSGLPLSVGVGGGYAAIILN